jgi:hypothetical protein
MLSSMPMVYNICRTLRFGDADIISTIPTFQVPILLRFEKCTKHISNSIFIDRYCSLNYVRLIHYMYMVSGRLN